MILCKNCKCNLCRHKINCINDIDLAVGAVGVHNAGLGAGSANGVLNKVVTVGDIDLNFANGTGATAGVAGIAVREELAGCISVAGGGKDLHAGLVDNSAVSALVEGLAVGGAASCHRIENSEVMSLSQILSGYNHLVAAGQLAVAEAATVVGTTGDGAISSLLSAKVIYINGDVTESLDLAISLRNVGVVATRAGIVCLNAVNAALSGNSLMVNDIADAGFISLDSSVAFAIPLATSKAKGAGLGPNVLIAGDELGVCLGDSNGVVVDLNSCSCGIVVKQLAAELAFELTVHRNSGALSVAVNVRRSNLALSSIIGVIIDVLANLAGILNHDIHATSGASDGVDQRSLAEDDVIVHLSPTVSSCGHSVLSSSLQDGAVNSDVTASLVAKGNSCVSGITVSKSLAGIRNVGNNSLQTTDGGSGLIAMSVGTNLNGVVVTRGSNPTIGCIPLSSNSVAKSIALHNQVNHVVVGLGNNNVCIGLSNKGSAFLDSESPAGALVGCLGTVNGAGSSLSRTRNETCLGPVVRLHRIGA